MANIKINDLPAATAVQDSDEIIVSQGTGAADVKKASLAVVKTWVNAGGTGPSGVTANNGLTETTGNIQLGGPLVQDTTVDATGFNLTLNQNINYDGGNVANQSFILDPGGSISINTAGVAIPTGTGTTDRPTSLFNNTGGSLQLIVGTNDLSSSTASLNFNTYENQVPSTDFLSLQPTFDLCLSNGSSYQGIGSNGGVLATGLGLGNISGIVVKDDINSKGFFYGADYSANGASDPRWIPDYAAVQAYVNSVGAGNLTFNGGLTNTSGVVGLGGALSADATIALQSGTLFFAYNSSPGVSVGTKFFPNGNVGLGASGAQADNGFTVNIYNTDGSGYFSAGNFVVGADGAAYINGAPDPADNSSLVPSTAWVNQFVNTAVVSSALAFSSGLTNTSGSVNLGGSLTRTTTIDAAGHVFNVSDTVNGSISFWLNAASKDIQLYYTDTTNNASGGLNANYQTGTQLVFTQPSTNHSQIIALSGASMTVFDNVNAKGLVYNADYSANYTSRSIPDVAWVQSQIASVTPGTPGGSTTQLQYNNAGAFAGSSNLTFNGSMLNVNNAALYVGNSTIAASALLQVDSTSKGFLPPRMTTAQKNAIASPAEGLTLYDSTLHKLCIYTGSAWETVTSA
jgi:hypothetical protein